MVLSVGVYNEKQLHSLKADTFFGRRRKFAFDLIDAIETSRSPKLRQVFVERAIDARRVSKRTYAGRFPAFDSLLLECIKQQIATRPFSILDAAVSDGSTSIELLRQIDANIGSSFSFTATDRDGDYKVLRDLESEGRRVVVSPRGEVIQIVWPPFIFDSVATTDNLFLFPVNRLARPYAMRYAAKAVKRWRRGDPSIEHQGLIFMSEAFRDTLRCDPRLRFVLWDITVPWTGEKFHCVRAMNILNPDYFSTGQLRGIVQNLKDCVLDGGLLAFGSNQGPGSDVDGAIYLVGNGRLVTLQLSGGGPRCPEALREFLAPQ